MRFMTLLACAGAATLAAHASAQVATFAISREVSVYAAPPEPASVALDAVSREVSIYAALPDPPEIAIDAISRECSVWRNPCSADFNNSGGTPDDADVAAFFNDWNNGDPRSDLNGSGGTPDDADLSYFFQHFNDGC